MKNDNPAPSILFTNLYLAARTGSELHVLQLAQAFRQAGWDVTCYTLVAGYPLLGLFKAAGIKVVQFGEEDELSESYDLLYAQHHIVSEHLLSNVDITFGHVIVSVLGWVTPHENPPSYVNSSDMCVFVSEECRNAFQNEMSQFEGQTYIFPNYADDILFSRAHVNRDQITSIAVISNHPPKEVLDLRTTLPEEVSITHYGWGTQSVEITPELIESYDLIITIGRTVQSCMALGVPVYVYDSFGGPGFLKPELLEEYTYSNYSGRSHPITRDSQSLWNDIATGYARCLQDLAQLKEYAANHYRFSVLFQELESRIESLPQRPSPLCLYDPQSVYAKNAELFAHLMRDKLTGSSFGIARLIFANKEEIQRSEELLYRYDTSISIDIRSLARDGETLQQFSPDIKPCACAVESSSFSPLNSDTPDEHERVDRYTDMQVFYHANPLYRCSSPCETLAFRTLPLDLRRSTVIQRQRCISAATSNKSARDQLKSVSGERDALRGTLAKRDAELKKTSKSLVNLQKRYATLEKHTNSIRWTYGRLLSLTKKRLKSSLPTSKTE